MNVQPYSKIPLELELVKKFLASGKREKLHYYLPSVTFALKTAYVYTSFFYRWSNRS